VGFGAQVCTSVRIWTANRLASNGRVLETANACGGAANQTSVWEVRLPRERLRVDGAGFGSFAAIIAGSKRSNAPVCGRYRLGPRGTIDGELHADCQPALRVICRAPTRMLWGIE
jgi:hypothetical protein